MSRVPLLCRLCRTTLPACARLTALLCVASLAGCGGGKSEQVSEYRSVTPPTVGPGSVAWERPLPGRSVGPPNPQPVVYPIMLTSDRTVLFAVRGTSSEGAYFSDARYYALDARTGDILWSDDSSPTLSPGSSGDDLALVGSPSEIAGASGLTARDARTGAVRWRRDLNRGWRLAFASGSLIGMVETVPSTSEAPAATRLLALDRETGATRWTVERAGTVGQVQAGPLPGGRVYLRVGNVPGVGVTVGLDGQTGATLWENYDLDYSDYNLTGATGFYTVGERKQRLDPATGGVTWSRDTPSLFSYWDGNKSAVGPDDTLYHIAEGDATNWEEIVEAVDPATGERRWSAAPAPAPTALARGFTLHGRAIISNITVGAGGNLFYFEQFTYVSSGADSVQQCVTSLDGSGKVRWSLPLFDARGLYDYFINPPAAPLLVGSNGYVYGTRGLNIVAVRTPDTR